MQGKHLQFTATSPCFTGHHLCQKTNSFTAAWTGRAISECSKKWSAFTGFQTGRELLQPGSNGVIRLTFNSLSRQSTDNDTVIAAPSVRPASCQTLSRSLYTRQLKSDFARDSPALKTQIDLDSSAGEVAATRKRASLTQTPAWG